MLGAILFAMLSAHAGLGRALSHIGLCRIREETHVPPATGDGAGRRERRGVSMASSSADDA
jgi:hypothetical protein